MFITSENMIIKLGIFKGFILKLLFTNLSVSHLPTRDGKFSLVKEREKKLAIEVALDKNIHYTVTPTFFKLCTKIKNKIIFRMKSRWDLTGLLQWLLKWTSAGNPLKILQLKVHPGKQLNNKITRILV